MPYFKVLIMDSGIGGLSIAQHIRQLPLNIAITYLADRAYFPYGDKLPSDLTNRVVAVVGKAIEMVNPDIVVLACNTASTTALAALRHVFSVPFVGVVPAIKPACYQSRSKKIGILATAGTAATDYLKQLIKDFALECEVVTYGSARLALLAEEKIKGRPVSNACIADEIKPIFDSQYGAEIDSIVLACTHFPLLLDELRAACTKQVHWIDSGQAIARRVHHLLEGIAGDSRDSHSGITQFLITEPDCAYDPAAVGVLLGNFKTELLKT